jgi:2-oxoisovalerate dehydrogenase E1 component
VKYYKHSNVVFSSQGESSVSEGYCYESINGASKEKLPVVFVFQDNGYGISVPKCDQTANEKISDNFRGFKNLRIIQVDGLDVFACMNAMEEAREHALKKSEPVIVDAECVRIGSHSNSDKHELYRDDKEIAEAKSKDPFVKFRKLLISSKKFSEKELLKLDDEAKEQMMEAHKKAMSAPDPDPASIYQYVIAEPYVSQKYPEGLHQVDQSQEANKKTMITALNETLKSTFRENPDTFMWGQDMANKEKGGIFNVSKGLQQEFGKERIFNAPIAEDYIVGTANGMSRFKKEMRIVVEGAEFADYFWPAFEQLIECSHDYWRTNGKYSPNIVIRLASGGYIGGGLYHSQNIEASLTPIPGIRVVAPAFADDAAGLLRTAIKSEGVTVYLEPKAQYNAKTSLAAYPDDFEVPFGKARIRKEGSDLTIVTYANAVHLSLQAAEKLKKDGYEVEVLDLRSLSPLDEESILKSVKKTNRVLVAHEDKVFAGFGGEVSALIMEKCFSYLDAPVKRVGSTFTPVGFNRILERAILPDAERIYRAAKEVLEY